MKLEGLKNPVRRERATSVLRQESEAEVNFDAERDLGEAYKLQLLWGAEEFFLRGIRDPSFFGGLTSLTTYYTLFPRDRDQVYVLLEKYKIKEKIFNRPGGVRSGIFIDVGILFPELKPQLREVARVLWVKMNPKERWMNPQVDRPFLLALNFISVDQEYLNEVMTSVSREKLFAAFQQVYQDKNWAVLLEFGAALRLCFPDEFRLPEFTPQAWRQMIKQVKERGRRPELGFGLAVLAAQHVSLLGSTGFQLTPQNPPLAESAGLPPRQTF